MMEKNRKIHRRKKGTFWMVGGMLLIAAAFFLTAFNIYDGMRAEKAARSVLDELTQKMDGRETSGIPENPGESGEAGNYDRADYELFPDKEMPAVEIDGEWYLGVLEIPALNRTLPVMEECSDDRLRTAPCRYSGSVYQNNMVIAGHNYLTHFAGLRGLPMGTEIRFTDVDGNVFHYAIDWIEVLQPDQVKEMTTGDWDLTLFTCTYGGQTRHAIRCIRVQK